MRPLATRLLQIVFVYIGVCIVINSFSSFEFSFSDDDSIEDSETKEIDQGREHHSLQRKKQKPLQSDCKSVPLSIREIQSNFSLPLLHNFRLPKPAIPALVLIAPPKSGTSTFMNVLSRYPNIVQYGHEHHHWNQAETHCIKSKHWREFLTQFSFNRANFSMLLNRFQLSDSCSIKEYQAKWIEMYQVQSPSLCWKNKRCTLPSLGVDSR